MFAKLTTKIALHKAGILSNTFSKDGNTAGATPFANPFANITVPKSWNSWASPTPPPVEVAVPPTIGIRAPAMGGKLRLPGTDGRPCLIVFLRFYGCPFAEKTFLVLRALANKYPSLRCIAISHSTKQAADKWVSVLGGSWAVEVIIDEDREVYASWGLGVSTTYYLLNPWTQMAARKLGTGEGIWGRSVGEGGNRWQIGGAWAVDERGILRWGGKAATADEQKDLSEGVRSLSIR